MFIMKYLNSKTGMAKIFSAIIFSGILFFSANFAKAQDQEATDKYYAANALYNKKLYKLATDEYKGFIAKYPDHQKILNAKLGLALCYYELRNYREAEAIFTELANQRTCPHKEQVHNLLGQCLLIAGRPEKAEHAFRWSVDRGKEKFYLELPGVGQGTGESPRIAVPTDLEPLERSLAGLIEALYQQSKWPEVVKTTADLVKIVPKGKFTPRARFLSALAYYEMKKYKPASNELQALIQSDPNFPFREQAYFLLGECQHQLGNIDNAIKNHEIVARQLKGKLAPNALFRMGYIKFMEKEYNSAIRDFSDLRAMYSKNKYAPEAGIYLGRCFLELKNFKKAQGVFGGLADKGEVKAKATLWLSETFLRQKQYETAIDILKPALRKFASDKLFPNLLFNYANALMGQNKFKEAADEFKRVSGDFKEFTLTADALRLKAFCENRGKDYEASLKTCDKFIKAYSQDPAAEDVGFLRAENLFFIKKYGEAIKAYRQFIPWEGLGKYTNEATFRITQSLCDMKKWDDALVEMKPLLQRDVKGEFFEQLYYLAGLCEYNLDNLEDSIKDFKKFAADHPTKINADAALLKAGLAYIKLKNSQKAMELLQKVVDAYPKSSYVPHALVELGKLQYDKKLYDKAEKNLKKVIADFPATIFVPQADYYLGWIEMERKKTEKALEHFQQVSKNHSDSPFAPDSLYQQGLIYLQKDNFGKAQAILKKYIDTYQNDPKIEQAQFYYAITLSRQKKYSNADDVFKTFISNNPKSKLIPRALYESAWRAREKKKINEARDNYKALLTEYPMGKLAERATFELAELEYEDGKYDEAIALLDKLMAKGLADQMQQKVLYRLGWCFLGRQQDKDALEAFERLIKTWEKSEFTPIAAYQAGELRLKMKDFDTAYNHFLLSVTSGKKSEVREQALLRLGEAQTLKDNWTGAKKTFETFMAEFPRSQYDRRARLWRGWCFENLKKYKEAITDYEAVLRYHIRDKLSARAQFQIGECYMSLKNYDKALKELVRVELNYGNFKDWTARAMLEMGQALDRKEEKQLAIEQYKKVVKKFSGTDEANLARELLINHKVYIDE